MENIFKVEIISPEKNIFSGDSTMVTLPAYEGDMGILKDHVPIVAFLKPGLLKVSKSQNNEEGFFLEDGIVEFSNNNLTVLSTSVKNINQVSKEFLENLKKKTEDEVNKTEISDEEKYLLNSKLNIIENIKI